MNRRSFIRNTIMGALAMSPLKTLKASKELNNLAITAPSGSMLWYDRPVSDFNEALPIGNGRLGAMVYGGISREKLSLNEDTLWAGLSAPSPSPDAQKALSQKISEK